MTGLPPIVGTARKLRRTMSLPEVLLWREMRLRPSGVKFRRQHRQSDYILDFYCAAARLAVEIDGWAHTTSVAADRDAARDAALMVQNIRVIRFRRPR